MVKENLYFKKIQKKYSFTFTENIELIMSNVDLKSFNLENFGKRKSNNFDLARKFIKQDIFKIASIYYLELFWEMHISLKKNLIKG